MAEDRGILTQPIVYDGEEYSRESLQDMVNTYQTQHSSRIQELESLKKTHDSISRELTQELAEQKSAWEYLRGMMTLDRHNAMSNFRGLLEKVPILKDRMPVRASARENSGGRESDPRGGPFPGQDGVGDGVHPSGHHSTE